MSELTLPVTRDKSSKTVRMIASLDSAFGGQYEIEANEDSSRYCPFTGGGDIRIVKKGRLTSAAVIQQMTSEDEDNDAREQPCPTPPATTYETTSTTASAASLQQVSTTTTSHGAPSVDITPPKEGELRCGATEHKYLSHVQSDEEVSMQLQE